MQELKKILDNAPKRATLVDTENNGYDYMYVDNTCEDGERIRTCLNDECAGIEFSDGDIRSIADIKRIVELTEKLDTLLKLHDNEVFVREPWDTTFEEIRTLLTHHDTE